MPASNNCMIHRFVNWEFDVFVNRYTICYWCQYQGRDLKNGWCTSTFSDTNFWSSCWQQCQGHELKIGRCTSTISDTNFWSSCWQQCQGHHFRFWSACTTWRWWWDHTDYESSTLESGTFNMHIVWCDLLYLVVFFSFFLLLEKIISHIYSCLSHKLDNCFAGQLHSGVKCRVHVVTV